MAHILKPSSSTGRRLGDPLLHEALDRQNPEEARILKYHWPDCLDTNQKHLFYSLYKALLRHEEYQKYRRGQEDQQLLERKRKKKKAGKDGVLECVWPEHQEVIFMIALVALPPCGRKKQNITGGTKAEGRNEIIVRMIRSTDNTLHHNDYRARKQISSHIQVLKKKLDSVPEFQRLIKKDMESRFNSSHPDELITDEEGREMRPAFDFAAPFPVLQHDSTSFALGHVLSQHQPHDLVYSRVSLLLTLSLYRLSIRSTCSFEETEITRLAPDERLPDLDLIGIPNWENRFPRLQKMHSSGEFDCQLILITVNCNMRREIDRDTERLAVRLAFHANGSEEHGLEADADTGSSRHAYRCATSVTSPFATCCDWDDIAPNSKCCVKENLYPYTTSHFEQPEDLHPRPEANNFMLAGDSIDFKEHLAKAFIEITEHAHNAAEERGLRSATEFTETNFQDIMNEGLSQLTVVQQITRRSSHTVLRDEQVVVMWEFKAVSDPANAITKWRKLTPAPRQLLGSNYPTAGDQIPDTKPIFNNSPAMSERNKLWLSAHTTSNQPIVPSSNPEGTADMHIWPAFPVYAHYSMPTPLDDGHRSQADAYPLGPYDHLPTIDLGEQVLCGNQAAGESESELFQPEGSHANVIDYPDWWYADHMDEQRYRSFSEGRLTPVTPPGREQAPSQQNCHQSPGTLALHQYTEINDHEQIDDDMAWEAWEEPCRPLAPLASDTFVLSQDAKASYWT